MLILEATRVFRKCEKFPIKSSPLDAVRSITVYNVNKDIVVIPVTTPTNVYDSLAPPASAASRDLLKSFGTSRISVPSE